MNFLILVTGGAGYIGSVTVAELVDAGEGVVVLDDLSTGHRSSVPPKVPFVQGDIADDALVRSVIREHGVRAVVHFAAKSLVAESTMDPLLYVRANLGKTAAFLESLRTEQVRSIVFSSTAAVYGEPEVVPIPERQPQRPVNPYGLTKWWIEQTLGWCERAWGLSWIALRYFNAAGGVPERSLAERHHPETHLIPRLLQAWQQQGPAEIFGADYPTADGTAVRDYVHVRDLAQAHRLALTAAQEGRSGVYNVGTGRGYSVLEVVSALEQETGTNLDHRVLPRRAGDPATLVADGSKIRQDFGWQPQYSDMRSIIRTALDALPFM